MNIFLKFIALMISLQLILSRIVLVSIGKKN